MRRKETFEEIGRRFLEAGRCCSMISLLGLTLSVLALATIAQAQDRSPRDGAGFQCFIPLPFNPRETRLKKLTGGPTGVDVLRTLAVARLLLDNVAHVKAYWVMCGLPVAQGALGFGVDDLDGTLVEEKIVHMAGADTPVGLTEEQIVRTIREAGRTPVERDSFYRRVIR